jgi:vacuolar-type H+-ATPase subunit I/STV1
MTAVFIGIAVALLQIISFEILKQFNKNSIYALSLAGIGFLYVGYTWTDIQTVIITSIQALIFVLIAYYGLAKNTYILAAGYFLHGLWDIVYHFWFDAALIPPHYDWFCSSLDFTVGIYLIAITMKQKLSVVRIK